MSNSRPGSEMKPILMKRHKEKQSFDREQKRLKEKHGIRDDVLVIEKSNMAKFIVKLVLSLVRFLVTAALLLLAATGLIGLIYPTPRADILTTLSEIIAQIKAYI